AAAHQPTADGYIRGLEPFDGLKISGLDLEKSEIERLMDTGYACLKLPAVAEVANRRSAQFAGLGQDPAVRADNGAEGHALAVAEDAHGALTGPGDRLTESRQEPAARFRGNVPRRVLPQRRRGDGHEQAEAGHERKDDFW